MKEFTGFKRGINLGGWLSQCVHTKEHYDSFIGEADIARIASWGLDHVRLPIDYNLIQNNDGTFIEEGFRYIDDCLEWCGKYGLNIIIDLHRAAGYFFYDSDEANTFFKSEDVQNIFYDLWSELARRYGKCSNAAFELLNEVVDTGVAKQWNMIARKAVERIREHAPKIPVLIGGVNNNSVARVPELDPPCDEYIIYNFHFYEPLIFTHQSAYWIEGMPLDFEMDYPCTFEDAIKYSEMHLPWGKDVEYNKMERENVDDGFIEEMISVAVKTAAERGVALYCGEYGIIDRVNERSTLNWYRDMNKVFTKYNIGRAAWNYKELDFGLIGEHYDNIREELVTLL